MARFRPLPPVEPDAPSVFRYADSERFREVLARSGFTVEHIESMHIPVMEAADGAGVVHWIRGFGGPVAKLAQELSLEEQRAWEAEVIRECEHYRTGGKVQLGGVTWLVVARR